MQHFDPVALFEAASNAAENAYCPYSEFKVGAAVYTKSGQVFSGCNVENASYGLTICAERVALSKAISDGHREFVAIAIVCSGDAMPYPCGACRQVLQELAPPDLSIFLASMERLDEVERYPLADLMPHPFVLEK